MKKILFLIFAKFHILIAVAQNSISNTIWFAHTEIPVSADIQLVFKKDSLFILNDNGKRLGESMIFSFRNDSLYIQKISGLIPCDNGTAGWYQVEWPKNTEGFLLKNINDPCMARANFFTQVKLTGRGSNNDKLASTGYEAPEKRFYMGAKDSSGGINLYRAYELLKGRKSQAVIVGLIGNYDVDHEDLKGIAWANTKEIPGILLIV